MSSKPHAISTVKLGILVTAFFLVVTATSCGFHLRGANQLSTTLPELNLETSSPNAPIIYTLKQWLKSSGVKLTETSYVTLHVSDIQNNKRTIAYDSRGNTAQYELTKSLSIRINNSKGQPLLKPTVINSRQPYNYDESDTAAKDEEQALLEREMNAAIINQVVRYLEKINVKRAVDTHSGITTGSNINTNTSINQSPTK